MIDRSKAPLVKCGETSPKRRGTLHARILFRVAPKNCKTLNIFLTVISLSLSLGENERIIYTYPRARSRSLSLRESERERERV